MKDGCVTGITARRGRIVVGAALSFVSDWSQLIYAAGYVLIAVAWFKGDRLGLFFFLFLAVALWLVTAFLSVLAYG